MTAEHAAVTRSRPSAERGGSISAKEGGDPLEAPFSQGSPSPAPWGGCAVGGAQRYCPRVAGRRALLAAPSVASADVCVERARLLFACHSPRAFLSGFSAGKPFPTSPSHVCHLFPRAHCGWSWEVGAAVLLSGAGVCASPVARLVGVAPLRPICFHRLPCVEPAFLEVPEVSGHRPVRPRRWAATLSTWCTGALRGQALGQPGLSLSPSCALPTPPAPKLQGLECQAEPGRPAGATLHPCSLVLFRPSPSCPPSHGILSASWSQDPRPSVLCEMGGSCTVVASAVTPRCGISAVCHLPPELCASWFYRIAAALQLLSRGRVLGLWTVSTHVSCEVHALLRTHTRMPVHTLCRPLPSCLQRGRWPLCRSGSWIRASRSDHDEKRAEAYPGQSSLPTAGRSRDGYCRSARPPELRTPACPPRGAALLSWPFSWRSYTNSSLCTFHQQQTEGVLASRPGKHRPSVPGAETEPPMPLGLAVSAAQVPPWPFCGQTPAQPQRLPWGWGWGQVAGVPPSPPGESQERPLTGSSASGRPSCGFQARVTVSPRVPSSHGSSTSSRAACVSLTNSQAEDADAGTSRWLFTLWKDSCRLMRQIIYPVGSVTPSDQWLCAQLWGHSCLEPPKGAVTRAHRRCGLPGRGGQSDRPPRGPTARGTTANLWDPGGRWAGGPMVNKLRKTESRQEPR